MEWDDIKTITLFLLICIIVIFSLFFVAYRYEVEIHKANLIQITESDKIIYQGKQAFVAIESGGMTTTIIVYKQLFPYEVVDFSCSSPNIKVIPIKSIN